MITVHHLENSRSQRILWLLEELETTKMIKAKLLLEAAKQQMVEEGSESEQEWQDDDDDIVCLD